MKFKFKIRSIEALYLSCYIAFIATCYIFEQIVYKPRALWMLCSIIVIGLYFFMVLYDRYTLKELLLRLVIILLFGISSIISNKPKVLVYAALLCGAEMTSFRKIVKTCFWTCLIVIISTFLLNLTGILSTSGGYSRFGVNIRTFGFAYYSIVPYTFFYLVLDYLYIRFDQNKKASWIELLLIVLINYLIYRMTTLRLTYYLLYFVIAFYILFIKFKWFNLKNRFLNFLTVLIYPLMFALSVWMNSSFSLSDPNFVVLNKLLSNRLYLGHQAMNLYRVNLFGNAIETYNNSPTEYFYIDCGFLFSLLGYGLMFTGLIMVIYIYMHNYSARVNNKMLFIWLTAVALFSTTNNTWLSVEFNPILLMFPSILKDSQNERILLKNAKRHGIVRGVNESERQTTRYQFGSNQGDGNGICY